MVKLYLRFLICLIIFLLLTIVLVGASNIQRRWYWGHQNIDNVREQIFVSTTRLDVIHKSSITVDNTIHNESDWVTFFFSPTFSSRDVVENYKASVNLQTQEWGGGDAFQPNKKAVYTFTNTSDFFEYNVSLKSLKGWNSIIFNTNYTLLGRVYKTGDFDYTFYYITQIDGDTKNINLIFYFPNNFEITAFNGKGEWGYGRSHKDFIVSGEDSKKSLYFVFHDINEEKEFLRKKQKEDRAFANIQLIMGVILGAVLGFFSNIIYDIYKIKLKTFFRNVLKIIKDK